MDRNEASYIQNRKGERIYIRDDVFREYMENRTQTITNLIVAEVETCCSIVEEIYNKI